MSNEIAELTENMISELALKETSKDAECLPLSRISSLGSILKNAFSYIGVNFEISVPNKNSLYTVQNLSAGDVLKKSKGDFSWGAIKAADGKSKMAKLKEVDALCVKKVATVNPALIIMAATLHSLEKKIDKLQEYGERIISFLENEKQSEIIADVQTLLGIITNYKYNWDNDMYLTNNHKMVLDIQRTSRGNINFYQKTISDLLSKKESSKTQKQTEESLNGFINAFKYLRMSLYTYSMSSLLEVMISGNFNESFVSNKKADIEELADNYREQFEKCSVFIENISSKTLTNNVLKGIGAASGTAGKVFSSIPVVKKGHVAKALKNKSEEIKTNTRENDEKGVKEFSLFHNPQINIFVEKLDDIVRINKTSKVAVTDDKIYLIQDTNI